MAYDKTQQARIDAGLCKDCGAPRGSSKSTIRCSPCNSAASKRATAATARIREARREAGQCARCGSDIGGASRLCDPCRDFSNALLTKKRPAKKERHMAAGLCTRCKRPRYHESRSCRKHYIENMALKYSVLASDMDILLNRLESGGFRCCYSNIEIVPGRNASLDHVVPRNGAKDESGDIGNLVWCDLEVNRMKGSKSVEEFVALCRAIAELACGEGVRLGMHQHSEQSSMKQEPVS